jgi:hypothetical protein
VSVDQESARAVGELASAYEAWQAKPGRPEVEGPARLLALVEAVRKCCVRGDAIDQDAVAALHESTGLDFRVADDAVMFELADDNNPGKTQTIAVRPAQARFE